MQQREEWVNTAVTEICNEHPVCTGCPLKLSPGQYYCSNDKYYAELLVILEKLGYTDTKVTDNIILESDIMSILE